MFQKIASYLSAFLLAVFLSACATPGPQPGEMDIRSGVIEEITLVQLQSNQHAGIGAVVGGIAGLGLGSLIGGGSGRDVAMVLGTIGGAYAGNEVQKKYDQPVQGQQIIVRTSNGVLISVTQAINQNLYKGQRVYVEGNGDGARVVPR
ncbi:glycine zipper 2TM domain-containing protein [Propionivibrio sp.]|uniref:glycine zipper 2TM domain-containing protein n=1 Tax=Propionivibrio sp. TaxID=2212460 RepID=UPI003BF08272